MHNGGQPKPRPGPPGPYRSTVMTDSPPPSGRPETAKMAALRAAPAAPVRHWRHRPDARPAGAHAAARRARRHRRLQRHPRHHPPANSPASHVVLPEPGCRGPIPHRRSARSRLPGLRHEARRHARRARAAGQRSLRAHAPSREGRHDREDAGRHRRAGGRPQAARREAARAAQEAEARGRRGDQPA